MTQIESIIAGSPHTHAAQTLFREYGNFLRATKSACGHFSQAALGKEIETMPLPYTSKGGEVLLATIANEPAACVAYRLTTDSKTSEIKRLYVRPTARNQGLARLLIAEAIRRIPTPRIILDTDVVTMPGAYQLYQSFGFREYGQRQGNIAFLELQRLDLQRTTASN